MSEFLSTLLQAVIIAAVPVCATFIGKSLSALAQYIHKKAEIEVGWKYAADITAAVSTAVTYVSQTYVDGLKKSDKFTKENQEEALNRAIEKATNLLTHEAILFLEDAYGDLNAYLTSRIEAEVRNQKNGAPVVDLATSTAPAESAEVATVAATTAAATAATVVQTSIAQMAAMVSEETAEPVEQVVDEKNGEPPEAPQPAPMKHEFYFGIPGAEGDEE